MDTGRQRASNDKVLDGYLICKPYLERENAKRARRLKTNDSSCWSRESIRARVISQSTETEREKEKQKEAERKRVRERGRENTLALNLHVYSPDARAYRRGGLTRSRSDETGPREARGRGRIGGGGSNHERAPGDIDATITTGKGAQLVPAANLAGDVIVSLRGAHCLYPP